MPWPLALLLTFGLVYLGMRGPPLLLALVVLGTALWAAYDSKEIGLQRYKSGISLSPPALFFGILLIWIAGFPWYLIVRGKIKAGTAVLKDATLAGPTP